MFVHAAAVVALAGHTILFCARPTCCMLSDSDDGFDPIEIATASTAPAVLLPPVSEDYKFSDDVNREIMSAIFKRAKTSHTQAWDNPITRQCWTRDLTT